MVSYFAPNGHYSGDRGLLRSALDVAAPSTAPAGNNGRYLYGAAAGSRRSSWNATNYFVDVVFRSAQN